MKKFKSSILVLLVLLFISNFGFSQDKFRVHEDIVKPTHVTEYEGILAEMMALVKTHKLQDTNWFTLATNNSHYLYVSPLKNFAEIDKPSFVAQLAEKAGKDVVNDLFDRMDKCYDTELDYTITMDKELSYMPSGITQTPEGQNYRQMHFMYFTPSMRSTVKEKMTAIKKLHESKGSKVYYRVYKSGFGTDGEYYMVAMAAKNAMDYAKMGEENDVIMGNELQKAIGDMYFNCLKYEKIEGDVRPDLSYSSN